MPVRSLLQKKTYFKTEYNGRRRTSSNIRVPLPFIGEQLAAILSHCDQSATCDSLTRRWSFEIMLDRKSFFFIPECLDVWGLKLPIIIGRIETCWKSGHLSYSCPKKQASGSQAPIDQNPLLVASVNFACLLLGSVGSAREQDLSFLKSPGLKTWTDARPLPALRATPWNQKRPHLKIYKKVRLDYFDRGQYASQCQQSMKDSSSRYSNFTLF